jgi:type I restriction enzyme R subunit
MDFFDKQSLSERDICAKFTNPAQEVAGWDLMHQNREQYCFTDGRF